MANLSQIKRDEMISFLNRLKEQHTDDISLIALNQIEMELTSKKFGLVWEKHEENVDLMMNTQIPVFTEIKEKEIIGDTANSRFNFLLEGDNLHSLKLLEKTHKNEIGVIYIDPPYNTNNKDFKYDDSFVDTNDGYRHSKWISFMNERLSIAKKLLKKDGIILISIDENEVHQLFILCCEIFGDNNYIGEFIWKARSGKNGTDTFISAQHEYILIFAKDKTKVNFFQVTNVVEEDKNENLRQWGQAVYREDRPTMFYPVFYKQNHYLLPTYEEYEKIYADGQFDDSFLEHLCSKYKAQGYSVILPIIEGRYGRWRKGYSGMQELIDKKQLLHNEGKDGEIVLKKVIPSGKVSTMALDSLLLNSGSASTGTKEIKELFRDKSFDTTKPLELIEYLLSLYLYNRPNGIALDFFAGSGTTGHAVMNLNKRDGGQRTFILCTNNENGICEDVTYNRIKTVISGFRNDGSQYIISDKTKEVLLEEKMSLKMLKNANELLCRIQNITDNYKNAYDKIQTIFEDNKVKVIGVKDEKSLSTPANLKYYRTDFVEKNSENISEDLIIHIPEMIQLKYGIKIDGKKYVVIMNDDEMDSFEEKKLYNDDIEAVFISQDVLLTSSQEKILKEINTFIIPNCYFDSELREVGELW